MIFHLPLKGWADEKTLRRSVQYIREAAQIIEGEGWVQKAYKTECGYCAAGAITEAVHRRGITYAFLPMSSPASLTQAIHWRIYGEDITNFNDRAHTSGEVLGRLRQMADLVEEDLARW